MGDLRLPHGVTVPERELEFRTARSAGPGGQGVNTTDSKVELRWDVGASRALDDRQRALVFERLASRLTKDGVLILAGSEYRSQQRNREAVQARFVALVGEALTPPRRRRRSRPSRRSRQRRLASKRQRGELKRLRKPPDDG